MTATSASRSIGVAQLGHGFMGDAHSRALRAIGAVTWPAPAYPRLISVSGRDAVRLEVSRARYGWLEATTDWRAQVRDPRVAVLDNVAPNYLHVEPTLSALAHGKHVICEKPLAPSAADALRLWEAAERAGVVHVCGFNYRFFPAIRLARELIEAGELGPFLVHYRARFLVPRASSERGRGWRETDAASGGGVVGDLAAHHIDLARYLMGEVRGVTAALGVPPGQDGSVQPGLEDSVQAILAFDNGGSGTLEASRVANVPSVDSEIQVDGSRASVRFSLGRLNELQIVDEEGTRTIDATDPHHPFMHAWYPRGHGLGWDASFVHELDQALRVIAGELTADGHLPTFADGYRCAEVCDAIRRSAGTGCWEEIRYQLGAP